MKERDVGALIVGIVLGFLAAYLILVVARWFAHVGMFIMVSLLFPLMISLIASKRIILIALVPNLTMTLCLTFYFLFISPDVQGVEVLYAVSFTLVMSIFLALLVSVPIQLLRRRRTRSDDVHHVFSRDS